MTRYLILDRSENADCWLEGAEIEARSAQSAIRAYLDGADSKEGRYVAVPDRSWKPVTVKVETKTALRFS